MRELGTPEMQEVMIVLKVPTRIPGVGGATGPAASGVIARRSRLRWVIGAAGLVLLIVAGYFGYERFVATTAPPAPPQTVTVRRATVTSTVSSTGTVSPLTQAKLALQGSGTVAEVNIKVGDAVTKGQDLARLDAMSLTLQVSQARSQLSTAEAKLATLKAGSRSEDLQAAQFQLEAAKSKLDSMLAGGRPEDVTAAKASLDSARAKLSQLKSSPTEADLRSAEQAVASAQANVQKAQADLAKLKAGPTTEEIQNAELDVSRAKNSLWSAQLSRDGVCGNERNAQYQCDSANASVASAEIGVTVAQNNLAKLKAPPKPEDLASAEQAVASAQAQLRNAQAQLDQVKAGPKPEDLAAAQAAVTQAEQNLLLKQKPYTETDIQAQRLAVAQAEANLATKQVPYTEADLLSAQAAVDQAKAQLELAEYNLANATLKAPFDGVVGAVNVNVGEVATSPAVVLVNPKDVRLDVTVDEADIGRVQAGQRAVITFDSIPEGAFQGKVTAVAPSATIQSGVATYLVSVSIADPGPVRPGMTGNASIVYGDQQNVLVVPNRAIRTQGRSRVVEVLANGQRETREVKVGISNDQMTEVTEGLAEGDQVIVSATTTTQPWVVGGSPLGAPIGGPAGGGGQPIRQPGR